MGGIDSRVSEHTVWRVVKLHFKCKWKAMERLRLEDEKARVRLHCASAWFPDVEKLTEVWLFKVSVDVALITKLYD